MPYISKNKIDIVLERSDIVDSVIYDNRTTKSEFSIQGNEYVFWFGCNNYKLIYEKKTDKGLPLKEVWYHPLLRTVIVIDVLKDEMCCHNGECERYMEYKVTIFKVIAKK